MKIKLIDIVWDDPQGRDDLPKELETTLSPFGSLRLQPPTDKDIEELKTRLAEEYGCGIINLDWCKPFPSGVPEEFHEEPMLVMDGYDDCVVGVVEQFGRPPIVCYDKQKVLAKLVADGMDEDEAAEWWSYNQVGAWCGDTTPCFITLPSLA